MTDRDRLIELIHDSDYSLDSVRLADYLIENGVICPPCKVGDTIYQTDGVRIYSSTIREITYYAREVIFITENIVFDEQAINYSIFFTREEAEKVLEKTNTAINNGGLNDEHKSIF